MRSDFNLKGWMSGGRRKTGSHQHIADGLVYEVSKDEIQPEDYIEKEREADGEMRFRILTRRQLPDSQLQKPNVEDGYLCVLKEI